MSSLVPLYGQRFSKLIVVSRAESAKSGDAQWLCRCDCGNLTIARGRKLRQGTIKSCGCGKIKHKVENGKKYCSKCRKIKDIKEFTKDRNTFSGFDCWCKDCKRKCDRRYLMERGGREKKRKYQIRYYNLNKKKILKGNGRIMKKNWEEYRDNLHDLYIKHLLYPQFKKMSLITKEVIELKRVQVKIHRKINHFKNLLNETY